jgi:hypothetical protein
VHRVTAPTHSPEHRRFYSRPPDRSIEAYKGWILGLLSKLNPAALANDSPQFSDSEWEAHCRKFWEAADGACDSRTDNDTHESTSNSTLTWEKLETDEIDREMAALRFEPMPDDVQFIVIIGWDNTGKEKP